MDDQRVIFRLWCEERRYWMELETVVEQLADDYSDEFRAAFLSAVRDAARTLVRLASKLGVAPDSAALARAAELDQ
jgi:phage terminase small subunit